MIYNLGRVVPLFKGTYDASTTYGFLDVVYYDNSSWVALDTTTGNLPTDTTHWLPVALKGTTQDPTEAQIQQIISTVESYIQANNYVQDANYQHIDIVDNLKSNSDTKALSANQGWELSKRGSRISMVGTGNTELGSMYSSSFYCLNGHTYRIYPDNRTASDIFTGITYTTEGYELFVIRCRDFEGSSTGSTQLYYRGCNTKSTDLNEYYDVVADKNGIIILYARFTSGVAVNFYIEDITALNSEISDVNNEISEIQSEIEGINGEISEMNGEPLLINDFSGYELVSTNKTYQVSSGTCLGKTLSQLTTYSLSGTKNYRIPIEAGKYSHVKFLTFSSSSNYGCPMFDADGLMVGYLGMNSGILDNRVYATSPIPSTATEIIFSVFSSSSKLWLYPYDNRDITKINDDLYGRYNELYLNNSSNTDIFNFNYIRCGDGFIPSNVGRNIFNATYDSGGRYKYLSTGVKHYLIPIKGYDTIQFTTFKTSSNYGSAVLDKDGNIIDTIYRTYTADDYLIRPYTIPENACYIAWIPTTASGIQNKVILKRGKTFESGGSGSDVATNGISFKHGYYSSNGKFNESNTKAVSSIISYAKPFYLKLASEYCIKRVYMFDTNGNMVAYNDTLPSTGTGTLSYPRNMELPQYGIRLEVERRDGEVIDPNDKIIRNYYPFDERVKKTIPTNDKWGYFKARVNQMKNITWKALEKVPQCISQSGTRYTDYFFLKGSENRGLPYSETSEFSKYVGWNVSFRTYLTALLNKRSLIYTENISGAYRQSRYGIRYNGLGDLSSTYYGTVCTGLTTYMTGIDNTIVSSNWDAIYGMNVIAWGRHQEGNEFVKKVEGSNVQTTGEDIANLVQPMDFIWNTGHCSVVSDVYTDEEGNKKFICWTEQTMPRTQSTVYTMQTFADRLLSITNTEVSSGGYNGYKEWKIFRYSNWDTLTKKVKFDEIDNPDTPYIDTDIIDYSPEKLTIDPDICTFAGDYATFTDLPVESNYTQKYILNSTTNSATVLANQNKALLNVHRGGTLWNKIQIEKVNEDRTTAPVEYTLLDSNAWVLPSIKKTVDGQQVYVYSEDAPENEDWIIVDLKQLPTALSAGIYQARLVNDTGDETVYSGYTHFEILNLTFNATKDSQTNDWTATFSSTNGTPYLIRQEGINGIYRMRHAITSTELDNGYVVFPYSSSTNYNTIQASTYYVFLKLYVRGKYGDAVMRVSLWNE